MKQIRKQKYSWARWGVFTFLMGVGFVLNANEPQVEALDFQNSHLGTFEGNTTFTTSSGTGVQPTLAIEVKNQDGVTQHYETSEGSLMIPNTQEGATIKRAILKGNTLVNRFDNKCYDLSNWNGPLYRKFYFDNLEVGKEYVFYAPFKGVHTGRDTAVILRAGDRELYGKFADSHETINVKFTLTEGEKLHFDNYTIWGNALKVDYPEILILESKYYYDGISFFTGMQSVQMPTLTITNGEPEQIEKEQGQWIPNPAFKSTAIRFEEEVLLRSKGDVYDELDLMTGKLTQRLDENNNVLTKPIVRTVKLKAEPIFTPINQAEVSVVGDIDATIASVTLPTAPLSFKLNPNNAPEQQFIASEFSITNDSQAPLTIELKEFVQITDVLTDVAPDYYDEWKDLTKEESKKIALGLVPQKSENWLTLNPGTYYAAETSNEVLGRVRSRSTVDFKFTALHGQAFEKLPNPQYRLTFVFGF